MTLIVRAASPGAPCAVLLTAGARAGANLPRRNLLVKDTWSEAKKLSYSSKGRLDSPILARTCLSRRRDQTRIRESALRHCGQRTAFFRCQPEVEQNHAGPALLHSAMRKTPRKGIISGVVELAVVGLCAAIADDCASAIRARHRPCSFPTEQNRTARAAISLSSSLLVSPSP